MIGAWDEAAKAYKILDTPVNLDGVDIEIVRREEAEHTDDSESKPE